MSDPYSKLPAPVKKILENKHSANSEREMSLLGHLDELRSRLIIAAAALIFFSGVAFFFAGPVLELLVRPVSTMLPDPKIVLASPETMHLVVQPDGGLKLTKPEALLGAQRLESIAFIFPATADQPTTRTLSMGKTPKPQIVYPSPLDPIMMRIKVSLVLGILLSLVVWVHQIWLFISPGLTDKEKRVVRPVLGAAVLLFPLGALVAYGLLYLIIRLMQTYVVQGIDTLYNVVTYLQFVTTTMISFGIVFELPVVIALLARIGVVTPAFLSHYRRHIWVGLAVFSMIITPTTDPFTMLAAMIPLVFLFEISVLVARLMARMRQKEADELEAASPEP